MKQTYRNSLSAGLALALLYAPLAVAQQDQHQQPGGSAQHSAPAHSAPQQNMSHAAPPQQKADAHSQGQVSHEESHAAPSQPRYSSGHQWNHGDHYNGGRYVVGNWGYYHLEQPPYGYEWVQDGDQFILLAISTGIITSIIISTN